MTFSHILYQFLIGPLEMLFETVYVLAYRVTENSGLSIVALSLVMNILLLPLYKRADAIQQEERAVEKRLEPWVRHIRRTFHGDERFMMLQTYYRQNHYKPFYSLKGSLPLLLEVPFFIAAYHFLSHLESLNGASFGPIGDLGAPDGLLSIGTLTLHILPILMTGINLISGAIYSRGFSLKDKLQLYGMALIFLVLLYPSPSGLAFYWTLNNLFSLGKNIVMSLAKRRKKEKAEKTVLPAAPAGNKRSFVLGCLFLTLLGGGLIPSAVVASSPAEFVILSSYESPLSHVLDAFLLAAGLFLAWFGIFYYVSGPRGRRVFETAFWVAAGLGICNYMFFGTDLGTLSPALRYDGGLVIPDETCVLNFAVLGALATVLILLQKKKRQIVSALLALLCLAVGGMSVMNLSAISRACPDLERAAQESMDEKAHFTFSRTEKNVVVLMLDRAIGLYLPYILQEKPELKEKFDGFTFYPNTLSFGPFTNFGAPPLYGGYEYTPEEMNRRDQEMMVDKHNEAIKVMPVLFRGAGFDVTVCDPTYAGYRNIPVLSVFDDYPDIHRYNTEQGQFREAADPDEMKKIWSGHFFRYSLMKMAPLGFQPALYCEGTYFSSDAEKSAAVQVEDGLSQASGLKDSTMNSYAALHALPKMTRIGSGAGAFLMMSNQLTHEPMLFQTPAYTPSVEVDNREYDRLHADRFTADGRTMEVKEPLHMQHYHVNMAAMLQLAAWFDSLRENGVYDNTRIIIAADHGRNLKQFPELVLGKQPWEDVMFYNPLLLVKDFDSHGFHADDQLMTNADVPLLALSDLVRDPVNPFTGQPINDEIKKRGELHIIASMTFQIDINIGPAFKPAPWYAVHDNIFDTANWKELGTH